VVSPERIVSWRTQFRLRVRVYWPDAVCGGALTLATFFVHNVGYMLSAPYWTDESWVVISTKLPLGDLPRISASTPIGWDWLLRLMVVGGDERQRVVPLLFAALTVLAAYGYARVLPWSTVFLARLAAVLAGGAALLVPSALARNDLKQYTADAFMTLLLLLLVSRLESGWTRRRLVTVGVVAVMGFLFSAVSLFVAVPVFVCLLASAALTHRWSRVVEVVVVGAVTGAVLGLEFFVLYRPGLPPGLNAYWAANYLPIGAGWGATASFLRAGAQQVSRSLGMGRVWVDVLLIGGGVTTLIVLRRTLVACVAPLLVVEMVVLGAVKQYPLFDLRTSHFLATALAVTAAFGVAGCCALLSRMTARIAAGRFARFYWLNLLVPAAVAAVLAATFVVGIHTGVRSKTIPAEDLRTPTQYVAAHYMMGDTIVIPLLSNWGFSYYWPIGKPVVTVSSNLQRFIATFPDQPNILTARDGSAAGLYLVLARAAAALHESPSKHVWLIYQHISARELAAIAQSEQQLGLTQQQIVKDGLFLLVPAT